MKKKQIFATALALTMLCATATACGGKKNPDLTNKEVLNIVIPDLGYGTEWLSGVANGFTAKTGTKVNIDVTPNESGYVNAMRAGTAEYDIYVLRSDPYGLVASNAANVSGYECILADLDDVYESTVEGENVKFKDKMKDVYESYNRVDAKGNGEEHYYSVQWCDSIFSLVRNMKVWKDNWIVPNTTNELIALCEQIKGEQKTPFIWSTQASYWWSVANIWVTQYEGVDAMFGEEGFWNGYDKDGNVNQPTMWARQGIYECLDVLDNLMQEENGYQHALSKSVDFTTAQGYFLTESMGIAMMANGDWLYNEMKENYSTASIDMMKMPVVSAIRNHPDCEGTIESDEELSALIDAIDELGKDAPLNGMTNYFVSQKAFDKVYEARNVYTCGGNVNHIMVTPVYSDSISQAKAFYQYLATDEALKLFAQHSGGFTLCFDSSDEVKAESQKYANSFVKSSEAIKQNREVAPWPMNKSRLITLGGMKTFPTIEMDANEPEKIFAMKKGTGYMTAREMYNQNITNAASKWSVYLSNAGITE